MKISPIKCNLFQKTKPNVNFGSSRRTIYKTGEGDVFVKPFYDKEMKFTNSKKGQILCSNTTDFFRDDIYWGWLARNLNTLFPKDKKVNVYNFACSDGSEAYTLAISLIEKLGEKEAQRFFPIKATDIDPYIIEEAKSGRVFAEEYDIEKLKEETGNNIEKYFTMKKVENGYILEAKDILKNNIEFSRGDFLSGLDNIEKENNLILCRNFWAYLGEDEIIKCTKKLHKKLDESSIILIGHYDLDNGYPPSFLTELSFDCVTDIYGEEYMLKKYPYNESGEYENEKAIKRKIGAYRKRKLSKST